MERRRFLLAVFSLMLLATLLGIILGVLLDRSQLGVLRPPRGVPNSAQAEFQLMAEAWNTIERVYVDRSAIQPRRMAYSAISGMVDSLGDTGHSRFLTPDMVQEQHSFISGEFEGIGVEVRMQGGQVIIVSPMGGSPAEKAGLRAGDIIVKIDGQDISGMKLDDVVKLIVGPAGSQVTLTVQDPQSGETRDVTMTRARITIQNVTWDRLPGTTVAHLRIAGFGRGVGEDLQRALTAIQQDQSTGIILDLRNNPGGLLQEAVNTVSLFLSSGDALLVQDSAGKITSVPVENQGMVTDLPVVILVNSGTASASEIVAGALQDAQRATLVGDTTYGTGTVLNEFPLSDKSVLLLATEQWLTPKGRVIWHKGIDPDVRIPLAADATPLLPEMEKDLTAQDVLTCRDAQLLRASQLLIQADSSNR